MSLIDDLKDMKFTEAEANVYITLLKYGESTGYEISKYSGIARSKIYNHIEVLVGRGILETCNNDKTTLYKAITPEELIKLTKKSVDDTLKSFEYLTANLPKVEENDGIWEIEDYNRMLLKSMDIIKSSKKSLYIQIWMEDLTEELVEIINEKIDSMEEIVVILYDKDQKYNTKLKKYFPHGFEMERMEDIKHRWITVVADDEKFLYSGILFNKEASGIYTKNKILSFFAKEYVQHDAYCLKLIDKFRDEIIKEYGVEMSGIRDIYS